MTVSLVVETERRVVIFVEKITDIPLAAGDVVASTLEFLSEDGLMETFKCTHWDRKLPPEFFVDVRNGCPPEHRQAYEAALVQRAIRRNG